MKLNPKHTAATITALAGNAVILYFMTMVFRGDNYRVMSGAIVMALEILIFLLLSLILVNFKKTEQIGQGTLIGTGITLLVGFGICSSI